MARNCCENCMWWDKCRYRDCDICAQEDCEYFDSLCDSGDIIDVDGAKIEYAAVWEAYVDEYK